jgi:uncharacterized membrane protein
MVVIGASDSYFELISRPLFPIPLFSMATVIYIIMVVAYVWYIVRLLQKILNINNPKKEEEK